MLCHLAGVTRSIFSRGTIPDLRTHVSGPTRYDQLFAYCNPILVNDLAIDHFQWRISQSLQTGGTCIVWKFKSQTKLFSSWNPTRYNNRGKLPHKEHFFLSLEGESTFMLGSRKSPIIFCHALRGNIISPDLYFLYVTTQNIVTLAKLEKNKSIANRLWIDFPNKNSHSPVPAGVIG